MSQINIAVVIDTATLAQTKPGGTWNEPTYIGSYAESNVCVFMIAQSQYVVNNQAKSELTISAKIGDLINFTVTSPDAGIDFCPIFYNAQLNNKNVMDVGSILINWDKYLLSSGGKGAEPIFSDLIPDGQPGAGNPNNCITSTWQMIVTSVGSGTTQYDMWFAIIDTNTGSVIGYYVWDPFIDITN